jgi:hypothetical protein
MNIRKRTAILAAATAVNAGIIVTAYPNLNSAANVFLLVLTIKSWIFVSLYAFRSNWTATAPGRAVMRLMFCIAVLCTQGTATLYFGADYFGRAFVRVALIGFITLAVLDLLLTLVAVQRTGGDTP